MKKTVRRLDALDRKILAVLQENSDLQIAEIAERIGLSVTPCWRRIQRLKDAGVIRKQVALLDSKKLNLGVTAFVSVRTLNRTGEWFARFRQVVEERPEIVDFYRLSGDVDYLLRVVVHDFSAFDNLYRYLTESIELLDVRSSFAMEEIKSTTALPLNHI